MEQGSNDEPKGVSMMPIMVSHQEDTQKKPWFTIDPPRRAPKNQFQKGRKVILTRSKNRNVQIITWGVIWEWVTSKSVWMVIFMIASTIVMTIYMDEIMAFFEMIVGYIQRAGPWYFSFSCDHAI